MYHLVFSFILLVSSPLLHGREYSSDGHKLISGFAATTDLDRVSKTIYQWSKAWQEKNLQQYFSTYHSQFNPRKHRDLFSWMEDRQRKITRPQWIRISIDDFEITVEEGDVMTIRFWLRYRSNRYSDNTYKELQLTRSNRQWLISSEMNLRILKPQ